MPFIDSPPRRRRSPSPRGYRNRGPPPRRRSPSPRRGYGPRYPGPDPRYRRRSRSPPRGGPPGRYRSPSPGRRIMGPPRARSPLPRRSRSPDRRPPSPRRPASPFPSREAPRERALSPISTQSRRSSVPPRQRSPSPVRDRRLASRSPELARSRPLEHPSGPRPCKFGNQCYHPACQFSHPDDRDLQANMARNADILHRRNGIRPPRAPTPPRYPPSSIVPPRSGAFAPGRPPLDTHDEWDRERERERGWDPRHRAPLPARPNPLEERANFVPSMHNSLPSNRGGRAFLAPLDSGAPDWNRRDGRDDRRDERDRRDDRREERRDDRGRRDDRWEGRRDDWRREEPLRKPERRTVPRGPGTPSAIPQIDAQIQSIRMHRLTTLLQSTLQSTLAVFKETTELTRLEEERRQVTDARLALERAVDAYNTGVVSV